MAITRSRYNKIPVITGYDLLSNSYFPSLCTMKDVYPLLFVVMQYVKMTALHCSNLVLGVIFTSDKEVDDKNMKTCSRS